MFYMHVLRSCTNVMNTPASVMRGPAKVMMTCRTLSFGLKPPAPFVPHGGIENCRFRYHFLPCLHDYFLKRGSSCQAERPLLQSLVLPDPPYPYSTPQLTQLTPANFFDLTCQMSYQRNFLFPAFKAGFRGKWELTVADQISNS
jgi:hypothetical protein